MLARPTLFPVRWPHRPASFGGDDELIAFVMQPAADDLLGSSDQAQVSTHRVRVGGVDEIHTCLCGDVKSLVGRFFVGLFAEWCGAEAYLRDGQTARAKLCVLH